MEICQNATLQMFRVSERESLAVHMWRRERVRVSECVHVCVWSKQKCTTRDNDTHRPSKNQTTEALLILETNSGSTFVHSGLTFGRLPAKSSSTFRPKSSKNYRRRGNRRKQFFWIEVLRSCKVDVTVALNWCFLEAEPRLDSSLPPHPSPPLARRSHGLAEEDFGHAQERAGMQTHASAAHKLTCEIGCAVCACVCIRERESVCVTEVNKCCMKLNFGHLSPSLSLSFSLSTFHLHRSLPLPLSLSHLSLSLSLILSLSLSQGSHRWL